MIKCNFEVMVAFFASIGLNSETVGFQFSWWFGSFFATTMTVCQQILSNNTHPKLEYEQMWLHFDTTILYFQIFDGLEDD